MVNDAKGFEIFYDYNEAGNLTLLTYPGGKSVRYTYDALNRLETVTIEWLNKTAFYYYDEAGRLTDFINFNGTWTEYAYDDADRLIGMDCATSDLAIISGYQFTLDGNGNRTRVDRLEPLRSIFKAELTAYQYNPQRNRLTAAGGFTYNYDFEGQLSEINDTTYEFDYDHRLVAVSDAESSSYVYDGRDKRLEAMRDGTITKYIYDAAGNLLAEAGPSNTITRYYIYGQGLMAMVTPTDELYGYNFDAIGSTIAMTDDSGQIVNAYAYTPFGRITNKQETIAQPFTFVGQHGVMTEPNGFYYMRARYYDPQTGRFISQDPLGFDGGDVNLYIYAANNPVLLIDPNGLWITTVIGAASGGLSGLMSGLQSGNVWAGVAGGVAGTLAGGAIGTFAGPLAARLAGAAAGSVIAGAIAGGSGGAAGGAVAAAVSGDSISQGITTGAITGAITGAVSGPIGHLAKIGVAEMAGTTIGRTAIALATENVGLSVGLGAGILYNPKP